MLDDFKTTWHASELAIDAAYELGHFEQPRQGQRKLTTSSGKRTTTSLTFKDEIEILIGYEHDLQMHSTSIRHDDLHDWTGKPWCLYYREGEEEENWTASSVREDLMLTFPPAISLPRFHRRYEKYDLSVDPLSQRMAVSIHCWSNDEIPMTKWYRTEEDIDPILVPEDRDTDLDPDEATIPLHLQPDWIQQIDEKRQAWTWNNGHFLDGKPQRIVVRSWYLNPHRHPVWREWRPISFSANSDLWIHDIRSVWHDMVEREEPIYIDVVQPEAPRSIGEEHIVCDLILSQQTEWYERPCLIVGSFINYHGGSMNHAFAMILPMHITHWELIYASGHDRFCAVPGHLLPFHRECNAHRCDLLPVPPHPIDVERGDCLIITMGVPEEIWPVEDAEDDATSLLAAPERMHPAFPPVQQPTQETDGSQEEEASTPDSDDWFTIQAFSLQHPPAAGRVNWRSYDALHRSIAEIMHISRHDLQQFWQVNEAPRDLAQLHNQIFVTLLHWDALPGRDQQVVLVDVQFHHVHPEVQPETVREARLVPTRATRQQILKLLGLQAYCDRTQPHGCLLWINNVLKFTQYEGFHVIQNGDYIKVAVPPESTALEAIPTRTVAGLCHRGLTFGAINHRHAQQRITRGNATLLPLLEPHAEDTVLLQNTMRIRRKEEDDGFDKTQLPLTCHKENADPLRPLREAREQQELQRQRGEWQPDVDAIGLTLQSLHNLALHMAQSNLLPAGAFQIQTWYLSHDHARRCNIPRTVQLQEDIWNWYHTMTTMWRDEIDPMEPIEFHLVEPQPYELEYGIWAHVLLIQHPVHHDIGVHITLFDPGVHEGRAVRFAAITSARVHHDTLLDLADRDRLCEYQGYNCKTWLGWQEMTNLGAVNCHDGHSFAITMERPDLPQPVPGAWDNYDVETAETMQLLQRGKSTKKIINLEQALRSTNLVFLTPVVPTRGFPEFIEIDEPHDADQVTQELARWGFQVTAYSFGAHDAYFCVFHEYIHVTEDHVYMYVNEDPTDAQGRILHSGLPDVTELEHMRTLHTLGYIRAAIRHQVKLQPWLTQVMFAETYGEMEAQTKKKASPTWPKAFPPRDSHQKPSEVLQQLPLTQPQCCLKLPGTLAQIEAVLNSSSNRITTDLEGLDLPDWVLQAIQATEQLDHLDRLVIYTDGSAASNTNRQIPDCGRDPNELIDSWAFVVLGEQYTDEGSPSKLQFLGWHTQRVLYEEASPQFAGARFAGSHTAEREAMLWALIWRAGIDSDIPTVFRPDSQVTGAQAAGRCGAHTHDYGFMLLRSTYQFLEAIIGRKYLSIDWTPGHSGDPWNEIADVAAKTESRKSFYMDRVRVDLREWESNWYHLWTVFEQNAGLPERTIHGFDASAPSLPSQDQHDPVPTAPKDRHVCMNFNLAIATGNVNSLYAGPDGHAGKLAYLRAQMQSHHLHFLGIQESRAEPCASTTDRILRLAGGADEGHFGVELWVNLAQPYSHINRKAQYFQPHHFAVVHADPRTLLVSIVSEWLRCWCLVIHAPQSGQTAHQRCSWWDSLHRVLHDHLDGRELFVLMDANAGCGPQDGKHVFSDGAHTPNTDHLCRFLQDFELCLPSTSSIHQGPRDTWTSPDGACTACIDYAAVPQHRMDHCTMSRVLDDFDLGQTFDHSPAALDLTWSEWQSHTTTAKTAARPAYQRAHITGQPMFQDLRVATWQTDIEQHVRTFTHQVHEELSSHCRLGPVQAKKPYMNEELWTLRTMKLQSKKALKRHIIDHNRLSLKQCFRAWMRGRKEPEDAADPYSAQCKLLKLSAKQFSSARALRQALKSRKQASLTHALESMPAIASSSQVLQIIKEHWGPTNPKKIQKKPLPIVDDAEGNPCSTPTQALDRWIDFFCEMEGGKRVSAQEQRALWRGHLEELCEQEFQLDFSTMPSLTELEIAFRRVSSGKATGPDGIPSEACKYHASSMAKATYAQLMKLLLRGQEDLSHKGGRLVKAWKGKGPQRECSSYRSLLISSHPGKVVHRALRMHQATLFESFLQAQQLGGRRGVPVQLGLHQARSFQRWHLTQNQCHAFLLLDLQEAFYRVLRPLALDTPMTDFQVAEVVRRLGLSPSTMHAIMDNLKQPSAIQTAQLHWTQRKAASAIHHDTHFWMDHQLDRCVTYVGTRPGDSFADLIFSYAWSRILKLYEAQLVSHDVISQIPTCTSWTPYDEVDDGAGVIPFLGPCWMDDLAIGICATSCSALEAKVALAGSLLLDLCETHGMTPNLKPGKTEAILVFRGRQSRQYKTKYYKPGVPAQLPVICEERVRHIHVTGAYLHLGNMLHHSGRSAMELRRRVAIAQQAFTQHRRLLYHNRALSWTRRRELFDTLILTKLLYGSETWVIPDWRTKEFFHAAVMKLYKRLLRLPHDFAGTDMAILAQGDLVSPSTLLRRQRLRYLGTLYANDEIVTWGLLQADTAWNQLIQGDLDWMYAQLHHASDLPDPRLRYSYWGYLMKDHRRYWKRLINRAVRHEVRQVTRIQEVTQFHFEFTQLLQQAGELTTPSPTAPVRRTMYHFGCLKCQLPCKNRAGEAVHMCKAHKILARQRYFFDGTQCPSCLKEFFTHGKLLNHLRNVRPCSEQLQARQIACVPAPGHGSLHNEQLARQHDGLCPPLNAEGPLPQPGRRAGIVDFDMTLYEEIVNKLLETEATELEQVLRACCRTHAVSWTVFGANP